MALKAVVESLEGLPESLHEHYKEQDGKLVLSVERVGGLGLANADKLENALRQERKSKEDALKITKMIPEGKTIEELLEASTKLAEIGDLSELETLDEKLAERTKQLEEKFAGDKGRLETKFTTDLSARDKQIEALTGQLHGEIVRGAALKAIGDNDGVSELLLPVVMSSVKVERDESGKMVARVLDSDGQVRFSPTAGSTKEMTISELVSEMRESDTYARAFNGTDAGGGGTQKPKGGGSGASYKISQADAADPAKYRAAKDEAAKAGKPLVMTD